MRIVEQIDRKLNESKTPDPDSLKSFTTVDGKTYKLAIVQRMSAIRGSVMDKSFIYLTPDKKYYAGGTYSGGPTGAGVNRYGGEFKTDEFEFVGWY